MAMTGVARELRLLKAARVSIREIERTVLVYKLDQKVFQFAQALSLPLSPVKQANDFSTVCRPNLSLAIVI
jgi:hypothetical protein